MSAPRLTLLIAPLLLLACQDAIPMPDFERMLDQRRGKPYAASSYLPHGQLMQYAPDDVVPYRNPGPGPGERSSIPEPLDRALLQRGRDRFDVFCATCHGVDGSGHAPVAEHMALRAPPSLTEARVRSLSVGRVFDVISQGYGLMPAYAYQLTPHDRWAVVAYLRALQRSQNSLLASLPAHVQAAAAEALR